MAHGVDDSDLLFPPGDGDSLGDSEPSDEGPAVEPVAPWRLLLVDDSEDIQRATILTLKGLEFRGRRIEVLSAYSGKEARELLAREADIAVVLLDVVMEAEDAGLRLVHYIRRDLRDSMVRIILRTGMVDLSKERGIILEYDINDYRAKSELGYNQLFISVIGALRTYEELWNIEKGKRDFLNLISHETRTPLNGILGMAELLVSDPDLDRETVVELAQSIQESGKKLWNLVDKATLITRLDEGIELSPQPFAVVPLVERIAREIGDAIEQKEVSIEWEVEECTLEMDITLTTRAVRNVLLNAALFNRQGGKMKLIGTMDDDYYCLRVMDEGPGVPAEIQKHLFERFAVTDVEHHQRGHGLGLALAHKILLEHGGMLKLESSSEDGSVFAIFLPRNVDSMTVL